METSEQITVRKCADGWFEAEASFEGRTQLTAGKTRGSAVRQLKRRLTDWRAAGMWK